MDEFERIINRAIRNQQRKARDQKARRALIIILSIIITALLTGAVICLTNGTINNIGKRSEQYACEQQYNKLAQAYNRLNNTVDQAKTRVNSMQNGDNKARLLQQLDKDIPQPVNAQCDANPDKSMQQFQQQEADYNNSRAQLIQLMHH